MRLVERMRVLRVVAPVKTSAGMVEMLLAMAVKLVRLLQWMKDE
jgi:hypothetical protein